jgi:hypothetical protein
MRRLVRRPAPGHAPAGESSASVCHRAPPKGACVTRTRREARGRAGLGGGGWGGGARGGVRWLDLVVVVGALHGGSGREQPGGFHANAGQDRPAHCLA